MTRLNPDNKCAKLWVMTTKDDVKKFFGNQTLVDVINTMLGMQNDLQHFVAKSKPNSGNKAPSECSSVEGSQFAIYYNGCATAEFTEMMERIPGYNLEEDNEDRLETWYEYIDIWHFLMNVILYSGVASITSTVANRDYSKDINASTLFISEASEKLSKNADWVSYLGDCCNICQSELTGELYARYGYLTEALGAIINILPYKRWKTYASTEVDSIALNTAINNMVVIFLELGCLLGITANDFKVLYVSKNKENHDRQVRGY